MSTAPHKQQFTPDAKAEQTEPRIAVLLPCFNEEAAIAQTVIRFQAALPQAEIYVYDNNSTDRTREVAAAAGVEADPFGFQEQAADIPVGRAGQAGDPAEMVDHAVRGHVVRADVHRPADFACLAGRAEQPRHRAVSDDPARRDPADEPVSGTDAARGRRL